MSMNPPPPPPPPMPPGYTPYSATPAVAGGRPLAEAWKRMVARALDIIVPGLIFGALGAAIVLSDGDDAGFGGFGGDVNMGSRYAISIIGLILGFVYTAVLTKVAGGTPFKLVFGMKVVREDGAPLTWKDSIVRWAVSGLTPLIPVLGGIIALVIGIVGIVFLFTKPTRQTVSDLVAKTVVINGR